MSYNSQATVRWAANTEADLAGYRIYAGTASRTYDPARTSSTTGLSQVMATLNNGQTYYFSVTAFDQTGNESTFSAEVSKTINVSILQLIRRVA